MIQKTHKTKIGLIDIDSHNFPNIPLMKLSAYHKQKGDSVEWYSPMFSGHMDKVYMSKVFSFTPDYEYVVNADVTVKGGSGYAITLENGREFYDKANDPDLPGYIEHIYPDYSLYDIQDVAYGFLTRGCPRRCSFCHVGSKEGACSVQVAELGEFWRGQKEIVLCDPNILACKDRKMLLASLAESGAKVEFNQGLDARLITESNLALLKEIKLQKIHFALDRWEDFERLKDTFRWIAKETGWNRNKQPPTVYILVNFDTTIEQDIERIQFCRELGWTPYPMIYNKEHANPIYRKLQRWCNNFIFWNVERFEDYKAV